MKIEKKVWPQYFQKILDGVKKYELHLAVFDCKPGDVVLLREWDPAAKNYTGREIEKSVTYVLRTLDVDFWSQEDIEKFGLQIISFD